MKMGRRCHRILVTSHIHSQGKAQAMVGTRLVSGMLPEVRG